MSIRETIEEEVVKFLDNVNIDDIKEVVKDTATIIKDVSDIVSETKKRITSETNDTCTSLIKYKLEDFKYWCQLRMTDVEFCYNMAKAELQVHNLWDYCKCSIVMMFIFILVHMIVFLFTLTISC